MKKLNILLSFAIISASFCGCATVNEVSQTAPPTTAVIATTAEPTTVAIVTTAEPTTVEPTTQPEEETLNLFELLGKNIEEVKEIFNSDYTETYKAEGGLIRYVSYIDYGLPYEIGYDPQDGNIVKYISIYNISDEPIELRDSITNLTSFSELSSLNIDGCSFSSAYLQINNTEVATLEFDDGYTIAFNWGYSDKNSAPADDVIICKTNN